MRGGELGSAVNSSPEAWKKQKQQRICQTDTTAE